MYARAGVRECVMTTKADALKIKGVLFDLPDEQQKAVKDHQTYLKNYLEQHGEDAIWAFALVAMELQE